MSICSIGPGKGSSFGHLQLCAYVQRPAVLVGGCVPSPGQACLPPSCAAPEGRGPLRLTPVSPAVPNPGRAQCRIST